MHGHVLDDAGRPANGCAHGVTFQRHIANRDHVTNLVCKGGATVNIEQRASAQVKLDLQRGLLLDPHTADIHILDPSVDDIWVEGVATTPAIRQAESDMRRHTVVPDMLSKISMRGFGCSWLNSIADSGRLLMF